MAVLVHDAAFFAWYVGTLREFPGGMTTVSIAARMCGVTREAVRYAIRTGKMRVRSWKREPGPLHLLPIGDVLTWHVERRRRSTIYCEQWDAYLRNCIRLDGRSIVRVGDVVMCEVCGETAVAVDNLRLVPSKQVKCSPALADKSS